MRTAGMREQGRGALVAWPGPAAECSVRGCGGTALAGNGMCVECAGMDRQYEEYFSVEQRRKRARIARRLESFAVVALFVVLMSWLVIELCPRLWVAVQLWRMGE